MNVFNFNKKFILLGLGLMLMGIVLCIMIFACFGFDISEFIKNSGNIYSPINWSSK